MFRIVKKNCKCSEIVLDEELGLINVWTVDDLQELLSPTTSKC